MFYRVYVDRDGLLRIIGRWQAAPRKRPSKCLAESTSSSRGRHDRIWEHIARQLATGDHAPKRITTAGLPHRSAMSQHHDVHRTARQASPDRVESMINRCRHADRGHHRHGPGTGRARPTAVPPHPAAARIRSSLYRQPSSSIPPRTPNKFKTCAICRHRASPAPMSARAGAASSKSPDEAICARWAGTHCTSAS